MSLSCVLMLCSFGLQTSRPFLWLGWGLSRTRKARVEMLRAEREGSRTKCRSQVAKFSWVFSGARMQRQRLLYKAWLKGAGPLQGDSFERTHHRCRRPFSTLMCILNSICNDFYTSALLKEHAQSEAQIGSYAY